MISMNMIHRFPNSAFQDVRFFNKTIKEDLKVKHYFSRVELEPMIRDHLRSYHVEGGGEADNRRHHLNNLRKLVEAPSLMEPHATSTNPHHLLAQKNPYFNQWHSYAISPPPKQQDMNAETLQNFYVAETKERFESWCSNSSLQSEDEKSCKRPHEDNQTFSFWKKWDEEGGMPSRTTLQGRGIHCECPNDKVHLQGLIHDEIVLRKRYKVGACILGGLVTVPVAALLAPISAVSFLSYCAVKARKNPPQALAESHRLQSLLFCLQCNKVLGKESRLSPREGKIWHIL